VNKGIWRDLRKGYEILRLGSAIGCVLAPAFRRSTGLQPLPLTEIVALALTWLTYGGTWGRTTYSRPFHFNCPLHARVSGPVSRSPGSVPAARKPRAGCGRHFVGRSIPIATPADIRAG